MLAGIQGVLGKVATSSLHTFTKVPVNLQSLCVLKIHLSYPVAIKRPQYEM